MRQRIQKSIDGQQHRICLENKEARSRASACQTNPEQQSPQDSRHKMRVALKYQAKFAASLCSPQLSWRKQNLGRPFVLHARVSCVAGNFRRNHFSAQASSGRCTSTQSTMPTSIQAVIWRNRTLGHRRPSDFAVLPWSWWARCAGSRCNAPH